MKLPYPFDITVRTYCTRSPLGEITTSNNEVFRLFEHYLVEDESIRVLIWNDEFL